MSLKDKKAFAKLQFSVKGGADIVAVDNGDMTSGELANSGKQLSKTAERSLYLGSAVVIWRSQTDASKVELTVTNGKAKKTVKLETK